jgi:hypothetical protein
MPAHEASFGERYVVCSCGKFPEQEGVEAHYAALERVCGCLRRLSLPRLRRGRRRAQRGGPVPPLFIRLGAPRLK